MVAAMSEDKTKLEEFTGPVVIGNAVSLSASVVDKELPKRIKILDWGENKGRTTGAEILVNEVTLSALAANQERAALDKVELDYEHQSYPKHPNYKEAPRHSAAHGVIEVIEGEGVFLSGLDYTPNGEAHALSYPDVSAVAHVDSNKNLILVSSVALTQKGDVAGMLFAEHVEALSALSTTAKPIEENQKPPMENKDNKFRDLLVALLGIKPADGADNVSDEDIVSAAQARMEGPKPSDDDKGEEVAMSARMDALEKTIIVQGAGLEGKVIPLSAESIEKMPKADLEKFIEGLPAGEVPLSAKTGEEVPSDKVVALSASEKEVCKQLGLTEEQYREHNG